MYEIAGEVLLNPAFACNCRICGQSEYFPQNSDRNLTTFCKHRDPGISNYMLPATKHREKISFYFDLSGASLEAIEQVLEISEPHFLHSGLHSHFLQTSTKRISSRKNSLQRQTWYKPRYVLKTTASNLNWFTKFILICFSRVCQDSNFNHGRLL